VRTWESSVDAAGLRFGVVVARFNHLISVRLLEGCAEELERRGAEAADIHVAWVPGAFEIPLAARALADSRRYHGLVALGAVIRGGTPHFDYVCRSVTDGLREVMRDTGVPVGFGVLTCDDLDQALARAGGAEGNKGAEAARAAVEMARLAPRLSRCEPEVETGPGGGGSAP
jgi:6,7-dimethyl-8-ribityllumazine synthase